jgi:hypothetical protein
MDMRRAPRLPSAPFSGESDEPTFLLRRFLSISLSGLRCDSSFRAVGLPAGAGCTFGRGREGVELV